MTGRAAGMLVLMLIAGAASAAELGRLFFTPAQRATLDDMRKKNAGGSVNEQAATPLPQNVSVNGVIRRSDGKNTIWLNNRVIGDKQADGINARVGKTNDRVRLSVPESGRSVDLKVGQTVEITSGTVEESYLRRPAVKPDVKSTPSPVKTDSVVQKRTPRAGDRESADDAGRDTAASGSK